MRSDRLSSFNDVGNIRFTVFVQRRGHADDDRVHILNPREVGRRGESLALNRRLDRFRSDVLYITPAGTEGVHLPWINVQSEDGRPGAGELKREGQADVAQANNAYFHDR